MHTEQNRSTEVVDWDSEQRSAIHDKQHPEQEITLLVCKAFTGQIVRARVSLYDTVDQAIPVIADQIEYNSPDWEKIGLYNLTRDFEYDMNRRFIDQGTEDGDLVIMADGAACHK